MDGIYTKRLEIRKRSRAHRLIRRRRCRLLIALAVLVLLGCLMTAITSYAKSAGSAQPVYKYYTEIRIHSGDTLTSIAGKYYSSDFKSKGAYIDEVKSINHLKSDKIIAGHNLIVPYYSVIEKH